MYLVSRWFYHSLSRMASRPGASYAVLISVVSVCFSLPFLWTWESPSVKSRVVLYLLVLTECERKEARKIFLGLLAWAGVNSETLLQ